VLHWEPFDRTGAGRQRYKEEERPQVSFHEIDPEISGFLKDNRGK